MPCPAALLLRVQRLASSCHPDFWVEQLVTTSSVQEWASKVTIEATDTTPGSWAERVEMSKAIRCYAHERGAKVLDIKEEQVVNSELGVKGYAKLRESRPGAAPRPGGDGRRHQNLLRRQCNCRILGPLLVTLLRRTPRTRLQKQQQKRGEQTSDNLTLITSSMAIVQS